MGVAGGGHAPRRAGGSGGQCDGDFSIFEHAPRCRHGRVRGARRRERRGTAQQEQEE